MKTTTKSIIQIARELELVRQAEILAEEQAEQAKQDSAASDGLAHFIMNYQDVADACALDDIAITAQANNYGDITIMFSYLDEECRARYDLSNGHVRVEGESVGHFYTLPEFAQALFTHLIQPAQARAEYKTRGEEPELED